jgi:hypothetical protein
METRSKRKETGKDMAAQRLESQGEKPVHTHGAAMIATNMAHINKTSYTPTSDPETMTSCAWKQFLTRQKAHAKARISSRSMKRIKEKIPTTWKDNGA